MSGDTEGTVILWDTVQGKEKQTLYLHEAGVIGMCYAPDGKILATASADGEIKLWDPSTGTKHVCWKSHQEGMSSLAYSPDGQTLATGGLDRTVVVWDVTTAKEKASLQNKGAFMLWHSSLTVKSGRRPKTAKLNLGCRQFREGKPQSYGNDSPLWASPRTDEDDCRKPGGSRQPVGSTPAAIRWSSNTKGRGSERSPWRGRRSIGFGMNSDFSLIGWELDRSSVAVLQWIISEAHERPSVGFITDH